MWYNFNKILWWRWESYGNLYWEFRTFFIYTADERIESNNKNINAGFSEFELEDIAK